MSDDFDSGAWEAISLFVLGGKQLKVIISVIKPFVEFPFPIVKGLELCLLFNFSFQPCSVSLSLSLSLSSSLSLSQTSPQQESANLFTVLLLLFYTILAEI